MIWIANSLVALVAVLHLYFLVLEMFLWTKPLGLKTFHNSSEKAADSAVLAANHGSTTGSSLLASSGGCFRARPPSPSRSKYSSCSA
jgi:putative membrane protein